MADNVENKQPMKTDKPLGILSLIVGIILSIGLLGTLKIFIQTSIYLVMAFTGNADSYKVGYSIGYVSMEILFIYLIIKLFKYSSKKLSNHDNQEDEETTS